MIHEGLTHTSKLVVTDSDTAIALGAGDMPVLATPRIKQGEISIKTLTMNKIIISAILAAGFMISCQGSSNNKTEKVESSADSSVYSFQDCDVTMCGIHFTKMWNDADKCVSEQDGVITFTAPEHTDIFIDPNDAKLSAHTAKILFTEVDNTKPFTFSARIKPGFTPNGLYHAGTLVVMANDTLWQKFCFEQDERGKHRVVTVRTIGTSDDNNHEVITQDFIYYKISSDTRTIASYYSLDGKEWQMVRLYRNNYGNDLKLGICSQAPQEDVCTSEFSELKLNTDNVKDFRMGE